MIGFLKRLFRKSSQQPSNQSAATDGYSNFAFVLLTELHLPDARELERVFPTYAPSRVTMRVKTPTKSQDVEGLELLLSTGERCLVVLFPIPVPGGEADEAFDRSFSAVRGKSWNVPSHSAQLLVTFSGPRDSSPIQQLSRFTAVLASILKCSPSPGVYWGNAGATHDAEFFLKIAEPSDAKLNLMLITGLSRAKESDGRVSLLSRGMAQFDLPDLLLVTTPELYDQAIWVFFDLLSYLIDYGKPIPEGHTVGTDENQRLPVRYVPSPIDPKKTVWHIEYVQ